MNEPQRRTGAVIHISEQMLATLIELPAGYTIRTMWSEPHLRGVRVLLDGPDLPVLADGVEAPMLPLRLEMVWARPFDPDAPPADLDELDVRTYPTLRIRWEDR